MTDPIIIKLFRLTQLIIEYLLYAQEELAHNLQNISKKYSLKKREIIRMRKDNIELEENNNYLKKQYLITVQATTLHSNKVQRLPW